MLKKPTTPNLSLLRLPVAMLAIVRAATTQETPSVYQQVLKIVGKSGDYKSNILKVKIPRNGLRVKIASYTVPTPFGFCGWFAMTKSDGGEGV
jgi:hypothetical protein